MRKEKNSKSMANNKSINKTQSKSLLIHFPGSYCCLMVALSLTSPLVLFGRRVACEWKESTRHTKGCFHWHVSVSHKRATSGHILKVWVICSWWQVTIMTTNGTCPKHVGFFMKYSLRYQ